MASKKIYLYKYDILNNKVSCSTQKIKDIINDMYNIKNKNVRLFQDGNRALIVEENQETYYSLDCLKKVNGTEVPEKYLFFRIGRTKEIDGALKRNKDTFKSEAVLNEKERKIYELEICTYILIDIESGIIIEVWGQFAPSVNTFINITNEYLHKDKKLENVTIINKNILTSKMIESFKDGGVRLGEIGYTYNIPNVNVLKELGLDMKQIQALEELDVFEVRVSLKSKPRIPLTKVSDKITYAVKAFEQCTKELKKTLFFKGNTSNSGNKKYTFTEEEVTYTINVDNYKIEDKEKMTISLDEMAEQIYIKVKNRYEGNKKDVLEYIK